jgi:squid-like protein/heterogeneous nuclear ribonucleoprotein A1/A3
MKVMRIRGMAACLGAVALAMLSACEVTGVGVDGSVGVVGYDGGYYEPYGYEYGGWGPGYRVGPGRGGDRRHEGGGDRHQDGGGDRHQDGGGDRHQGGGDRHQGGGASHSYRPAPASRPTPSIPNRPRGH